MVEPAIKSKYGPYYESALWRQLPQREAIGKAPITGGELAGATYGELEARYNVQRQRQAASWQKQQALADLDLKNKELESKKSGEMGKGLGSLASTGLTAYQTFKGAAIPTAAYLAGGEFGAEGLTGIASEAMPAYFAGGEIGAEGLTGIASGVELAGIGSEIGGSAGLLGGGAGLGASLGSTAGGAAAGGIAAGGAAAGGAAAGGAAAGAGGAAAATGAAAGGTSIGGTIAGLSALSVLGPIGIVAGLGALAFTLFASKKKVICTELHRQGLLDDDIYRADSEYGATLPIDVMIGYQVWAIHVVKLMERSLLFSRFVSLFAIPWAKEMAFRMGKYPKNNLIGKSINYIGIPMCRYIGRSVIRRSLRWQI